MRKVKTRKPLVRTRLRSSRLMTVRIFMDAPGLARGGNGRGRGRDIGLADVVEKNLVQRRLHELEAGDLEFGREEAEHLGDGGGGLGRGGEADLGVAAEVVDGLDA